MRGMLIMVLAGAFVLAGCETPKPKPTPPPPAAPAPEVKPAPPKPPAPPPAAPTPPPPPAKSAGEIALDDGVALYDAGDYNGAIKRLSESKELADAATPLRVKGHKYVAFSYCVTGRRPQCRAQFVEALKLDPGFALEAAERSHPIWSTEYEAAKRSMAQKPAPKPAPAKPAPKPPPKPAPKPAS